MKARPSGEYSVTGRLLEAIMTSVPAVQDLTTRIFYFSMTASVFIFISMLLIGIHP
jgi:hypothetical protein